MPAIVPKALPGAAAVVDQATFGAENCVRLKTFETSASTASEVSCHKLKLRFSEPLTLLTPSARKPRGAVRGEFPNLNCGVLEIAERSAEGWGVSISGKLKRAGSAGGRIRKGRIHEGEVIFQLVIGLQIIPAQPHIDGQLAVHLPGVLDVGSERLIAAIDLLHERLQAYCRRSADCTDQEAGIGVSAAGRSALRSGQRVGIGGEAGCADGEVGQGEKARGTVRTCVLHLEKLVARSESHRVTSLEPLHVVYENKCCR